MKGLAPSTLLLRACFRRTEVRSCKLRLASRLPYGENTRTLTPTCAGMTEKSSSRRIRNSSDQRCLYKTHFRCRRRGAPFQPCQSTGGEERPGRTVRRQFGGRRARKVLIYCSTLQTIAAIGFYRREAAPWRGLVGVPGGVVHRTVVERGGRFSIRRDLVPCWSRGRYV